MAAPNPITKQCSFPLWEYATTVCDLETYIRNDFKTEKQLCDYIEVNAELFARDVLNIDYLSHRREWRFGYDGVGISKYGNTPRIDFLFTDSRNKNILVECKNPTNIYSEVIIGIGQLMAYYCQAKLCGMNIHRMCLVTTKYNTIIQDILHEFNIPIELFILTKGHTLKVKI